MFQWNFSSVGYLWIVLIFIFIFISYLYVWYICLNMVQTTDFDMAQTQAGHTSLFCEGHHVMSSTMFSGASVPGHEIKSQFLSWIILVALCYWEWIHLKWRSKEKWDLITHDVSSFVMCGLSWFGYRSTDTHKIQIILIHSHSYHVSLVQSLRLLHLLYINKQRKIRGVMKAEEMSNLTKFKIFLKNI